MCAFYEPEEYYFTCSVNHLSAKCLVEQVKKVIQTNKVRRVSMAEEKKDAQQTPTDSGSGAAPAPTHAPKSKKKNKKFVIIGVVVVVIAILGFGFNAWHNTPGFCNSVCHDPMDYYVNGYNGNASTSQASAGAQEHKAENVSCLQCHEATIQEQVHEATAWVSGNYKMNSDGTLKKTLVTADKKMCVKSGCHNWDKIVAATEDWGGNSGVNPHRSHQGEAIDCSNCHGVHTQSMMYCNTCHDFKVPDGWATPEKSKITGGATSTTATAKASNL